MTLLPYVFTLASASAALTSAGVHIPPMLKSSDGQASALEIHRRLSPHAARRRLAKTRPGLARRNYVQRRRLAPSEYTVPLGPSRSPRRRIYGTPENNYLLIAPSRAGKSVALNAMFYDWPGAVVHTSSKADDLRDTINRRRAVGPVYVWDPMRLGKEPSSFRWDPIVGCDDHGMAMERAGYLLYGARSNAARSVDEFFSNAACDVLTAFLHAAALTRQNPDPDMHRTMVDVYRWSQNRANTEALEILRAHQVDPDWVAALAASQDVYAGTGDGIFTTLRVALKWMKHPGIAATVTPAPGEDFDAETFLLDRGTLYMIGQDSPGASVRALYVMFLQHLRESAIYLGQKSGGRMDPPLMMALDEVANICPVPLPDWMPDSGGRNITLAIVVQDRSQLHARWGRDAGDTIWGDANFHLVLAGISDRSTREDLAAMCGKHRRDVPRGGAYISEEVDTFTQHDIFTLPEGHVLVIKDGCLPVLVKPKPVYKRRNYQRYRPPTGPDAPREAVVVDVVEELS